MPKSLEIKVLRRDAICKKIGEMTCKHFAQFDDMQTTSDAACSMQNIRKEARNTTEVS
jgi:hypothetical protein